MENSRTPDQLAEMHRLQAAGLCLFCPENLQSHERQRVRWSTDHWTITPNEFPYQGTAHHLLLVPHQHASDMLDLSPAAQQDFWAALGKVRDELKLLYYGLGVRNGDCRFTGATIAHVHAHVLVAEPSTPEVPVRMRFSQHAH